MAIVIEGDDAMRPSGLSSIATHYQNLKIMEATLQARLPGTAITGATLEVAWKAMHDSPSKASINMMLVELGMVRVRLTSLAEQV
jgi:hypothetical protein